MKIAMVGLKGVPFPAGIENFTEQVGARLAERGHEVTVYVRPYVDVGDSYRGMRIKRLASVNTKHLDAASHTFLATLAIAFSDADIAHYHALGPSVLSGIPRLRRIRTIAHVHGLDWQRAKWSGFAKTCLRGGEYAAAHFPNRTIAISRALKQYFETRYGRYVDYVPTGVERYPYREPREIRKWGLDKEDYVLFLSRLVPEKGCHYLLEAFSGIQTDKKLVIAGPASHSKEYAQRLERAGGDNIIFTGVVGGRLLEELFANAYLFVLPSEIEGLPHALLQALSFGRCVLASDIEANVEAMGDCGLTFASRSVGDLRKKLRYLIENPEAVVERATGARMHVESNYSWDAIVDQLEDVYRRCLEQDRAPRVDAIEPTNGGTKKAC
jgi:glycosyltransferase involved in cell wall biosynthesis